MMARGLAIRIRQTACLANGLSLRATARRELWRGKRPFEFRRVSTILAQWPDFASNVRRWHQSSLKQCLALRGRSLAGRRNTTFHPGPSATLKDCNGGGGGIRTRDTVSRIHTFQACAFNHSATPPQALSPRESAVFSSRLCARPCPPARNRPEITLWSAAWKRRTIVMQGWCASANIGRFATPAPTGLPGKINHATAGRSATIPPVKSTPRDARRGPWPQSCQWRQP